MPDILPTNPTVADVAVPESPDLERMRRDRHAKLQGEMQTRGVDALVLIGTSAVSYATGAAAPGADASRALVARPVAVVVAGEDEPYLLTPFPEGAPKGLPGDRVLAPVLPDFDEGATALADFLGQVLTPGARIGFDEMTHSLRRVLAGWTATSATPALGAAKITKTVDELACIRVAQRINEQAMDDVHEMLRPGVRQNELTARFLRRIYELGAAANGIDPIWQIMPASLAEGPWTTHGGVAFPTAPAGHFFRERDVVWVDSGISYQGYASDFGRTWLVGSDPTPSGRQEAQFERWAAVTAAVLERLAPGVTAGELGRVATEMNGGVRPWIDHFYLAHGLGTDSAEMPLIGTDMGDDFDEQFVLRPGMVVVLEPVIWDDGAAGYRSEDIYAVADRGYIPLSNYPYDPFGRR